MPSPCTGAVPPGMGNRWSVVLPPREGTPQSDLRHRSLPSAPELQHSGRGSEDRQVLENWWRSSKEETLRWREDRLGRENQTEAETTQWIR